MANFENYKICPKCEGKNKITEKDWVDVHVIEIETLCTECEHQDYWVAGFYEPPEDSE